MTFNDQAKCHETALNQIQQGSRVVFQVAGGCGLGALQAAKENKVWGIGVDADQLRPSLLTERESQVLGLLAQMNSTEEIAAALFVSTNTVKTHLKGIFGKLGVNRRVDAVRRGRTLDLR